MSSKRRAHIKKQGSAVNFFSLPYEIRHQIYLFVCPPANIHVIIKSHKRVSCRVNEGWKKARLRDTNRNILQLLLTCKQMNTEYATTLYSQNTFSFDFNEESKLLHLRKLDITNLEALRKLKLNFKPVHVSEINFPRRWPDYPRVRTLYRPDRKRPAQDAIIAPMMAGLKEMDIFMFNPSGLAFIHDKGLDDRYEQWLKAIEPILRIMGRHVDRRTEVRLHYDNSHGLVMPVNELFDRCFGKGHFTICN